MALEVDGTMLMKLATALTVSGAVAAATGIGSATADPADAAGSTSTTSTTTLSPSTADATTTTSTTTTIPPASTTTSTSSVPASTTTLGHRPASQTAPLKPHGNPVNGAFYGNPKPGVDIAASAPGLYPVFGANSQPDLAGFSVVASPGPNQTKLTGVPDPQPVCSPDQSDAANTAPNLYCHTDTDNGFEFPMSDTIERFDFSVSSGPPGFTHDPDQSVPINSDQFACPNSQNGTDSCGDFNVGSADFFFDYIGIYRPIEVTVRNSSGQNLSGVTVTLTCHAPAGDPSDACPPAGEKTNVDTANGNSSSTAQSATTGKNGVASFSGAFLPGVTVSARVTPPAGYGAAGATDTVPTPVTASTTTGAEISAAARRAVVLAVVLPAAAPPTTASTSTTLPSAPTTTLARSSSPASALPLTGTSAESVAEDAGLLVIAGAGLVAASRRRARRGAHFKK